MKNRQKIEKPNPDTEPKTGVCVKESENQGKNRTDRYGVEPTFEDMQADLTGLYD